jgi:hypothetical protein
VSSVKATLACPSRFRHDLGVDAFAEQMRGVRMAKVVEPDPRQVEAFHRRGEQIAETVRPPE